MKVTKWSTFTGEFDRERTAAEQTSGEPGSLGAGPAAPRCRRAPVTAAAVTDSPESGAGQDRAVRRRPTRPRPTMPKAEVPKAEAAKAEAQAEPKGRGCPRPSRRQAGCAALPRQDHDHVARRPRLGRRRRRVRGGSPSRARACSASAGSPRWPPWWRWRRVAGALGGALATAGLDASCRRRCRRPPTDQRAGSLDRADRCRHPGAEGRRRAHLQARHEPVQQDQRPPRQGREGAGRTGRQTRQAQRGRRQAPRCAAGALGCRRRAAGRGRRKSPARSPPPAAAAACRCRCRSPKPEVGRLPTVEGWVLRDVANGGALIEGRRASSKSMPAIPCPASAASTPSAARTAAGWS